MEQSTIDALFQLIKDNPWNTTTIVSIVSAIAGTGVFSFLRRSKSTSQGEAKYFTDSRLLAPPMRRPAYSDRMAYVLAEMSALAYYEFEGTGGVVRDAAKHVLEAAFDEEEKMRTWLETFANDLMIKGVDSIDFFREILDKSDFELIDTINVAETQAFACKRVATGELPYVILAFRGTEKKISDWLTDVRAIPFEKTTVNEGTSKIHQGFRDALMTNKDSDGKTVLELIESILERPETRDTSGEPLPVFITGHSLGGALALLTSKELPQDLYGACYTFGAPRVANYEYFEGMKTPVFRVVNSSDIVPRVPPGAGLTLLVGVVKVLSWLTGFIPALPQLFEKLENKLDRLKGYRHFGDQRYLTDVKSGRFSEVKLLSNPPAIDRLIWMGHHLRASFVTPVQSHGMALYRKKLKHIANARNSSA